MTTSKYLFIILLYLQIGKTYSQDIHKDSTSLIQTKLAGILLDDQGEPLILGAVVLYKKGKVIAGVETNFDGQYIFTDISPGIYDIKISYVEYPHLEIPNIYIKENRNNKIDAKMVKGHSSPVCTYLFYTKPLIELDNMTSGKIYTREEISHSPHK